jgi:DNA-binding transcriptional ArsR family regulator
MAQSPLVTVADLDPVIHAPKRLGAIAMLAAAKWVEFSFLRQKLDLSDSDLSKQMAALCDAGYATIRKQGHGRGGKTWFAVTPSGRTALERHAAALRALVDDAPVAPDQPA